MIHKPLLGLTCLLIAAATGACGDADTEDKKIDSETTSDLADSDNSDSEEDGGIENETDGNTDDDSDTAATGVEIAGAYTTNFGASITITDLEWKDETTFDDVIYVSIYSISIYDNDANYLVAQNSADNDYNPEKWSRFDWVETEDTLYYCQSIFDAETEADADDGDGASDPSDLEAGCGGFSWSELIPH
jgi:hypothetical protein